MNDTLNAITRLRATIVTIKTCSDNAISLYTEYYEYVEQMCYAFPTHAGIVSLVSGRES